MSETPSIERAGTWVRRLYPDLSRRLIGEAFRTRLVTGPGGAKLSKGARVQEVDLDFRGLENFLKTLRTGKSLNVSILFEDASIWVIDKPAGMPSLPLHLHEKGTVTDWAFHQAPATAQEFSAIQPTLCPHRLDTGTSGVLVVAKTKESFEAWRTRFKSKEVQKSYLAWCWGNPSEETFTIDSPIGHCAGDRTRMRAHTEEGALMGLGREALTNFTVLKTLGDRFLCRADTETGVTHQVRVHLASIGHPLLGDELYDDQYEVRDTPLEHHLLRAVKLTSGELNFQADETAFSSLF